MRFEIAYCYPATHTQLAYTFLSTYLANPPMIDHGMVILTDPGNEAEAEELFFLCPNLRIFTSSDAAKDLGRYQAYSQVTGAECLMFLGGSSYCRRPGWGLRAFTVFENLGRQHLYGACGHTGQGPVHKHLRTTAFWVSPKMFNAYPLKANMGNRYEIEHGQQCLTGWFVQQGYQAYEVTFGRECASLQFNCDPQGYARGTQANLLMGDRLTAPPYMPFP